MIDDDAARTDLHAYMQHTVTAAPLRTPPTRCPRCARDVDPADLLAQPLAELRLIDPHVARYDRQPFSAREEVALCDACERQLDAIAQEMDTQRRRLARLWPLPTSPRERLMDDQCLSRTFEEIRDLHIECVLGRAVWYDQHGQDVYLVIYETGTWTIQPVPRGQVYDDLDDRGYLALPIPVAPPTADASSEDDAASSDNGDASSEDDSDDGDARAGSTLRAFDAAAFFRRHAPSDADREPLERDLTTRFYRTLYAQKEMPR